MKDQWRRRTTVMVALVGAILFGALDQWVGSRNNMFWTQVSGGLSALWLVVPLVAGLMSLTRRQALLGGLLATWLAVTAYALMIISPVEGTHLGPAPAGVHGTWNQLSVHLVLHTLVSQGQWFTLAVVAGPVCGMLGYRARRRRSWIYALPVALTLLLEPPARWVASRTGISHVPGIPFSWPGNGLAQSAEVLEFFVGLLAVWLILLLDAARRAATPSSRA